MILVGLESCGTCEIVKANYPNVPYFQLKKSGCEKSLAIKKALSKLGISHFPVLLKEDLSESIPLEELAKMA